MRGGLVDAVLVEDGRRVPVAVRRPQVLGGLRLGAAQLVGIANAAPGRTRATAMNSMVRRVIVPSWGVVVENTPWLGRAARL